MPPTFNGEIVKDSNALEKEAATVLGYMMFEYSRLDMELGLLLAWSNGGKDLDKLTKKISDEQRFYSKLEDLRLQARQKFSGTDIGKNYEDWCADADTVRLLRNQLFHGRWGFISEHQLVANVVGLPTSPEQSEFRYSIVQLQKMLEMMRELRHRLSLLRQNSPI